MYVCIFYLIFLCDKLLELKSKCMTELIIYETKCKEYVDKIQTIIKDKDKESDDEVLFEDLIDSFNITIESFDEIAEFMKIKNCLKYFERVYELLEKSWKEIYKIENDTESSAFFMYSTLSQKFNRLIREIYRGG
ncbi:hypothetical protein EHP00_489 [Ecytonucleospora hepatopenaei]|uniref:Uncharacterized protein n=1 Tax=Ecytonucleospora hepatopenaei TaxID=646526 RepID=A0A1W0E466_9MICR|nr:hypothetical protein EHP00_489 [Ecytonucleospora hepatopenaei]